MLNFITITSETKQMADYQARTILQSVQQSYDSFAEQWNTSRQNNWYEFSLWKQHLKSGDTLLDIGCGNGRFFGFLQDEKMSLQYQGVDNAKELISIARKNYPDASFTTGDALDLPYEDESFDSVVSFAVLHHITPRSNREKFFEEIARVLKPGGTAFITVWNIHQAKYKKYMQGQLGTKLLQYLRSPWNTSFGFNDCFIPFGEEKTMRYIHGFTPKELVTLASKDFEILETYFTLKDGTTDDWKGCRNICVSLQKH